MGFFTKHLAQETGEAYDRAVLARRLSHFLPQVSMTTSVNKRLVQVKIVERDKAKANLAELEKIIAALTLAAEIEEKEGLKELVLEKNPKKYQPKTSWAQLGIERTKKVTELLSAAAGELHFNYLAKQLGMKPVATKDWMLSQIDRKGSLCPWKIGKNKSYYVLR